MAFDVYQHGRQHVAAQDRVYQRPWRLLGNTTVTYDVATPTPDMLLRTLIHAREARRRAESYRHFLVGACGWAVKDDGQAFVVKHGANYKNGSGASSIDEHAEHMALSLLKPGSRLTLLAVVGIPQPDNGSSIESPTLHPCNKCRDELSTHPNVSSRLIIATATPDMRSVEWGTLPDYLAVHAGQDDRLQKARFETTPALFDPLPPAKAYELNQDLDIDTSEWDAKVTFPFAEWCRVALS